MKEKLFDKIASYGPRWSKHMHIMENGNEAYLVHLSGGVFFEIFKDADGVYYECEWAGCLVRTEPVDILAWITMLEESEK